MAIRASRPCPICDRPSALRGENPSFPFCSPRCRAVDLGRWLGEEYRVPEGRNDERDDGAASAAAGQGDDGDEGQGGGRNFPDA